MPSSDCWRSSPTRSSGTTRWPTCSGPTSRRSATPICCTPTPPAAPRPRRGHRERSRPADPHGARRLRAGQRRSTPGPAEFDERVAHARQTAATARPKPWSCTAGPCAADRAGCSRTCRICGSIRGGAGRPAPCGRGHRLRRPRATAEQARLRRGAPRRAAHEEPLHESLQARMMLALAGSGRRAAALQLFAELRVRLRRELGVEPSQEVWRAATPSSPWTPARPPVNPRVRGVPVAVRGAGHPCEPRRPAAAEPLRVIATPAQLPPPPQPFVGRGEQLDALDALLRPRGTDTARWASASCTDLPRRARAPSPSAGPTATAPTSGRTALRRPAGERHRTGAARHRAGPLPALVGRPGRVAARHHRGSPGAVPQHGRRAPVPAAARRRCRPRSGPRPAPRHARQRRPGHQQGATDRAGHP
ncbi:hypothetical protein F3L20_16035 [Streptomyces tendae]|uniref:Bacterial transcriptional activator domain-containing protein n=1 Tax=Streptomyces tendae TaxID=1932 RepID=A0ABX6A097_STRTE|nr:hypothetical protein F3L20_16035 [Streptomyces tendae]